MTKQLEADAALASIEHAIREATCELDGDWSPVGSGNAPATYTGGLPIRSRRITSLWDRDDGRYHPYYEHEYQLRAQRSVCRQLGTFTAVAVGAMQALQVYVMGGEWDYEVVPRYGQEVPAGFIDEVQRVVDELLEKNSFIGGLDNEVHDASREDGDSLVAMYAAPDGLCDMRRIDADNLRAPDSSANLDRWLGTDWRTPANNPAFSWSFGVLTGWDDRMKRIDHARSLGYHVVYDETGREYDFLPSWPMQGGDLADRCGHLVKRNTPAAAKRGISDYFPVITDLEREDKLNTNLSVGAAALAAIAWIEEMPAGTTRDQAESSLSNAIDDFSRAIALNKKPGDTRTVQNLRPGSVPKVSAGRVYHEGPLGQGRSPIYIAVRQAIVRRIETRWLMPEYIITADASNANYASTLVSGTPFIKAREGEQNGYKCDFREIMFKALKFAHDAGRFRRFVSTWQAFMELVDLTVTPPPIASEDKKTMLEEKFGIYDRGAMDANEMRTAFRMEPKEELEGKTGSGQGANPFGAGTPSLTSPPAVLVAHSQKLESLAARALLGISNRRHLSEQIKV